MAIREFPTAEIHHIDDGETKEQVIFNGKRVAAFIKAVAAGRPYEGIVYEYDEQLVDKIHDLVYMVPGVKGFIRQNSSTTVNDIQAAPARGLAEKFRLYGRWLHDQMDSLQANPDDLVKALEIAAGAHQGITMPETHFYDGGNGRTARALVNIILMSQTLELTAHGYAIPPIPILRAAETSDKYIDALSASDEKKSLFPLMLFLAKQWRRTLQERLEKINQRIPNPRTNADINLIRKLTWRNEQLRKFISHGAEEVRIESNGHGTRQFIQDPYPLPDYFRPRYVKFDSADRS